MIRLTTGRVCYTVLALHLFLVLITPIYDPDLWWHLRIGQYIFQTLRVPRADIYSFTVFGKPWLVPEWLSEAAMYGIYLLSGWRGLIVVFALINATAFLYIARRAQAPAQIVLLATVVSQTAALGTLWNPRPRWATLVFSAVFFVMLRAYMDDHSKRLWILPLLTVAWVNLHGGYPLGLALILLAGAALVLRGERRRLGHLALILALCLIAISINPYGARMFVYPFENQFSAARMSFIAEWRAPNFNGPGTWPFLLLLLGIVAALGLSKKRISWFDLLCLMLACFMSLRSWRHVSLLSLISIPILSEHSWNWISSTRYGQRIISGAGGRERPNSRDALLALLLILVVVVFHLPSVLRTIRGPVDLSQQPVAAIQFMQEQNLKDNVFSQYEWNDYLIWNAPSRKVFIDGRVDMYGDELLMTAVRLYTDGTDWEALFQRFGVNTVLIEPSSTLARLIKQNAAWSEVYRDPQAVIFIRK